MAMTRIARSVIGPEVFPHPWLHLPAPLAAFAGDFVMAYMNASPVFRYYEDVMIIKNKLMWPRPISIKS